MGNFEKTTQINRLLGGLPLPVRRQMEAILKPIELPLGEVLYRPGEQIAHVYFPTSGVISIVVNMSDGSSAEAGMVGNEGLLGIWVVLGAGTSPFEAIVQEPVVAFQASAEDFANLVESNSPIRDQLRRYTDAFLTMVSQSAACNGLHTAEQRLCRWLLMTHDRAGHDDLQITQQFIGRMLGVRRMSITPPARKLQAAGLIRYSRGRITIRDRAALEAAACECYQVVRNRLDTLLPPDQA